VRARAATLVLCGVACTCACGGGKPARAPARQSRVAAGEHWTGSLSPRPSPDAVAVAEVNGDTIWDADVARHAAARHLDARAALDELIELELLAQAAQKRGLSDDAEVAEARKQARTRALLHGDFAAGFKSPADVPEADIDLVWGNPKIYLRFNHQLYHEVRYLRVELKKDASPAEVEAARVQAETLRAAALAAAPASKDAFGEAVMAAAQPLGIKVVMADHAATQGGTVKEFLDAAMALTRVGDLSPVTRTPWGWDVLYLYNVIPDVHQSKQQATPELRKLIFEESRRRAFVGWAERLVHAARVVRHDELLYDDPSDEPPVKPQP